MIIWQGFGFLVPLVSLPALVPTEYATRALTPDPTCYQTHGWPELVGLWLAAAALSGLAKYFDAAPARVAIEKDTGREIALRESHSLFFVPLRFRPHVLAVPGVVLLFVDA